MRSSSRKLKPLPPDPFRHQDSVIARDAIPAIRERVPLGSTIDADGSRGWDNLHESYDMHRINHSVAFSKDGACTNHMWTAPACKGFCVCFGDLVGCGHMSGPFARRMWPLALMEFADRVPIKNARSRSALNYPGLPDPRLDRFAITSSSPSQSCGTDSPFRLLARRSP